MADITFKMLINGKMVEAEETFGVINPSTGKVFAQAPACSKAQLDEAVEGAKIAFKKWRLTSLAERRECLHKAMGKIQAEMPKIGDILCKEQGKPINNAMGEIGAIQYFLGEFAKLEIPEKVLVDNEKEKVVERRVPLGIVGGITPWNFPPLMAAWKLGEAVMTGNTIVIKPSPYTPLSTLMLGDCFVDTFPPGVVNFVCGPDEVGRWITIHPDIAKISFTGSTATGKKIQAATAGTLKRLTLELGGNDPAIVLPGADVKTTASKIFDKAMNNSGQVCTAIKRCFVPESMHDEFVKELAKKANATSVGDGFKKGVVYGPINNKMQFERVCGLVEDAKAQGAQVHAGGSPIPGDGYFYPPTIMSGVKEGCRLVDEEQFGPVLPVLPYKTEEEVVDRANDTKYGLGGSVWGPTEEAARIAAMIDAGTVWVNSHGDLSPDVPFGGRKESGLGRQMGSGTVEGYTDPGVIRIPKA